MVDIKLTVMGRLTQKHNILKQTTRNAVYFYSSSFLTVFKQCCYATSSCRNTINNLQTAEDPAGGSGLACCAARLLGYPVGII